MTQMDERTAEDWMELFYAEVDAHALAKKRIAELERENAELKDAIVTLWR